MLVVFYPPISTERYHSVQTTVEVESVPFEKIEDRNVVLAS